VFNHVSIKYTKKYERLTEITINLKYFLLLKMTDYTEQIDNYKDYTQTINDIKNTLNNILDELKNSYTKYKSNPEIESFYEQFNLNKQQLNDLQNQITNIDNNLNIQLEDIQTKFESYNKNLESSKSYFYKQKKISNSIKDTETGSYKLINDQKRLYNIQYYQNIQILFGILFIIFMFK